jgi:hypothetical protein
MGALVNPFSCAILLVKVTLGVTVFNNDPWNELEREIG